MTTKGISAAVLKDVVAYVDVWSASKTENYSDPFIQQLQDMGAQVSKTFNKQVTHVVFKHGHQSTWNKAKRLGVKTVSVCWVARCKENAEHVDEGLYPAQHEESTLSQLKKRTHRCMQPRDAPLSTPKRLKRKLDKMMEGLVRSSPIVSDTSPFIIDEENGIVYSPSSRRADTMAQRLREMRAQRENLSPTASQVQESELEDSPKPSLGKTPTDLSKQLLEEEEAPDLLDTRRRSSSDEVDKEYFDLPLTKTTSKRCVKKASSHSDITFNSSSKEPNKASVPPQSKKTRASCSGLTKQSSLDCFVHKTSKNSPSLPKPADGAIEKPRRSSCNSKKSISSSPLSSMESGIVQVPVCLKETKAHLNVAHSRRPSVGTSLPKRNCSAQPKDLTTPKTAQKVSSKKKPAPVVTSFETNPSGGDDSDDDDDDCVFEDYFSSAKNTPGRRVVLVDSSSKAVNLPTFDLEPLNQNRRKSIPQETCTGNTRQKVFSRKDKSEASSSRRGSVKASDEVITKTSGSARESKISAVPVVSRCEEMKQEPPAKRQKRRNQQNSVTSSESKDSKSTSDGLTDSCSEMCSKQGLMKTDRYMKKNRTLVMTSMPTEKQQTVLQVVNSLGGFTVVDTVCESTTHVVSGSPRRTLNVLLGIARGCWILSFEWILWCLEHRQWIPEEPYELSDHFPAAPICRLQQHLSAGEHQQDLFQDQPLMFVSPLSQPPCRSLVELIQLCGGSVCRSIRQAGLCIGQYKGKKPEGTKCLSEQWILDCVTHLVLLPYDNYILE
ncbi:microcephalin isoform X1 [Pygocentrus nattereri]|uniref:BRCT domain-containing protein n=1 Tax=Pygocentrus nattereri TaxID=42514 RepID=A0A3B4D8E9_PYGNA|nr:microcephalin isoform X1 [Pygocentrus nattereri]